jgi:AcrR family transcriptional regulator
MEKSRMPTSRDVNRVETKQEILRATLKILESEGIQKLTVRKIAAEAGTNIAAVNYHFGSKDRVVFEALQTLRARFGMAFTCLRNIERPPRERLVAFMTAYCDTVFEYPNLVKAFINQSLNLKIQQDYEAFVRREGLALITQTLAEILQVSEETLRMKAFQMMSSLILILLIGKDSGPVIGLDFSDPQVRVRYIQAIIPGDRG